MTYHTSETNSAQLQNTPPTRRPNKDTRSREYLKDTEVDLLIRAASQRRYPVRDSLIIRMLFTHGFRVQELCDLEWDLIDLKKEQLVAERDKNGATSLHSITREEKHALKELRKANPEARFVFLSERDTQFSPRGIFKIVQESGKVAGLGDHVHPHMLRHSKGYQLVNRGTDLRLIQAYLGHKNIRHTVRYTELDPKMLKGLEK